jgi:serine/threonine-protein kinase
VLRPELAAVIGGERFLAEIKVTANLQHPHILPLHRLGRGRRLLFYVMPLVEGESLRDRLTAREAARRRDAHPDRREVASALDYAHRHGVVHRDIKPENVLLHDGTALVADFGIALAGEQRRGEPHDGDRHVPRHDRLHEPRAGHGRPRGGARSDVYALGPMLYEMLVRRSAVTGSTAQAIVGQGAHRENRYRVTAAP